MKNARWLSVTIMLAIVLISAGIWRLMPRNAPSIAFVSPKGGESWQSGEPHTILWVTHGIPPSDLVSITIRRIPPPPLPKDGQEFDPILFTNLSNTGSTTWTISPLYPNGTYVLDINAYTSIPVTNPISVESQQFTITHPTLATVLYPLYSGANWNAPEMESFILGTSTYTGASITSAPEDAGMNPGSIFTPFEQYYDHLLRERGWSIANDLAAGGHVGGQTGYRKGTILILVRFHIDYQSQPKNAPSECPCTVTLSLFSSHN